MNFMILYRYISVILQLVCLTSLTSQSFLEKNISVLSMMSDNYGNAVADFDGDGDLDVFIVSYESFDKSNPMSWSRLLENRGFGRLVDVTKDVGLTNQYADADVRDNKIGVSWGDYNRDGYPDLFLTHANSFQLLRNEAGKTFVDVTREARMIPEDGSVYTSSVWWDYNNDGLIDIYVSNYQGANMMFSNNGDGTFKNISSSSGLKDEGSAWCSIVYDVNEDGWQDIYVINDYGLGRLYINDQGRFTDKTKEYGMVNSGNGMGATIGDYNNDGHFDIYITNIAELLPNVLFSGSETGVFEEKAEEMNIGLADWAWGTQFFDADHDTDEDLYVVNGFNDLQYENRFFKNMQIEEGGGFIDWSASSQTNKMANGMTSEVFDYDDDGDLDILVSNTNSSPYLFENVGATGNWLKINLKGTVSNENALGAKVKVSIGDKHLYRYNHGAGIMGQSIKPVHFGLSNNKLIDSITVQWPNSEAQVFYNVDANQSITFIEQADLITSVKDDIEVIKELESSFVLSSYFPNPSHGDVTFNVRTNQSGKIHLDLFSLYGSRILAKSVSAKVDQETIIEISKVKDAVSMPSGIYMFRLRMDNDIVVGKLIIE